ncbi:MazG family protein, partial [Proteiniclasticum sp.]|uniref:MazG family protein n=1 Tax=Proteiniclasticum sp. TaxID=2053595 RepID=UPI0028992E13
MIHIVGLGPGQSDALTLGALKALKSHSVFLRTEKHPTVSFLVEEGISYEAFDSVYEKSETFDEVYSTIADLLSSKGEKETFVYGVPGHPLVAEKSVLLLIEKCKEKGIPYEIHPAVSFVDAVFEALEVDPINGFRIVDALGIEDEVPDYHKGTLITQVFSPYIASRVKIALNAYLNDEDEIFYIRAAGTEEEVIRRIPLYELDRQRDADDLTSVYVPPMEGKYSFYDFMNIVKRLRDKDSGCPWDKEQTHESLKPYLIEESYEALEAIDLEDFDALREELGDVMLQVLLHSAISEEEGEFNIHEVVKVVSEKMIYRHPHVFQKDRDMTSDEVLIQWEALKKKEKGEETLSDSLRAISKYYPGLSR